MDCQIVVVVCLALGYWLKNTPRVPGWSIPYILSAVAIVFCCLLIGWGVQGVLQGFICSGLASLIYQGWHQARKQYLKDKEPMPDGE